jgi:hypothetical protein
MKTLKQIKQEINKLPMDFGSDGDYTDEEMIGIMISVIQRQGRILEDVKRLEVKEGLFTRLFGR